MPVQNLSDLSEDSDVSDKVIILVCMRYDLQFH